MSLDLQITTDSAQQALDDLTASLGKLDDGLSNIKSGGLDDLNSKLSNIKGIPDDAVASIEKLNDAIGKLSSAADMSGLVDSLNKLASVDVGSIAGNVERLAESLSKITVPEGLQGLADQLSRIKEATQGVGEGLASFGQSASNAGQGLGGLGQAASGVTENLSGVRSGAEGAAEGVMSMATRVASAAESFGGFGTAATIAKEGLTVFGEAAGGLPGILSAATIGLGLLFDKLKDGSNEVGQATENLQRQINAFSSNAEEAPAALEKLGKVANATGYTIEGLEKSFGKYMLTASQFGLTSEKAADNFAKVANAAKAVGADEGKIGTFLNSVDRAMANGTLTARLFGNSLQQIGLSLNKLDPDIAGLAYNTRISTSELQKVIDKMGAFKSVSLTVSEYLNKLSNSFRDMQASFSVGQLQTEGSALKALTGTIEEFQPELNKVSQVLGAVYGAFRALFEYVGAAAVGAIGAVIRIFTSLVSVLDTLTGGALSALWDAFKTGVGAITDFIAVVGSDLVEGLNKALQGLKTLASFIASEFGQTIKTGFENTKAWATSLWEDTLTKLKYDWDNNIPEWLKDAMKTFADTMKTGFENTKRIASEAWSTMVTNMKKDWDDFVGHVSQNQPDVDPGKKMRDATNNQTLPNNKAVAGKASPGGSAAFGQPGYDPTKAGPMSPDPNATGYGQVIKVPGGGLGGYERLINWNEKSLGRIPAVAGGGQMDSDEQVKALKDGVAAGLLKGLQDADAAGGLIPAGPQGGKEIPASPYPTAFDPESGKYNPVERTAGNKQAEGTSNIAGNMPDGLGIVDGIKDAMTKIGDMFTNSPGSSEMTGAMQTLGDVFSKVGDSFSSVGSTLGTAFSSAKDALSNLFSGMTQNTGALGDLSQAERATSDAAASNANKLGEVVQGQVKLDGTLVDNSNNLQTNTTEMKDVVGADKAVAASAQFQAESMKSAADVFNTSIPELGKGLESLVPSLTDNTSAVTAGAEAAGTVASAEDGLQSADEKLANAYQQQMQSEQAQTQADQNVVQGDQDLVSADDKLAQAISQINLSGGGNSTTQFDVGGVVGRWGGRSAGNLPLSLWAGARHFDDGGLTGGGIPIIAHDNEAVVPLKGGAIPVNLSGAGSAATVQAITDLKQTVINVGSLAHDDSGLLLAAVRQVDNDCAAFLSAFNAASARAAAASAAAAYASSQQTAGYYGGYQGAPTGATGGREGGSFSGNADYHIDDNSGMGTGSFTKGWFGTSSRGNYMPDGNGTIAPMVPQTLGTIYTSGNQGGITAAMIAEYAKAKAEEDKFYQNVQVKVQGGADLTGTGGFADGTPNTSMDVPGITGAGQHVLVHPDEGIVPLPDGRSIPVIFPQGRGGGGGGGGSHTTTVNQYNTVNVKDSKNPGTMDQQLQALSAQINRAVQTIGQSTLIDDPTKRLGR